jgi:hypothetical protein
MVMRTIRVIFLCLVGLLVLPIFALLVVGAYLVAVPVVALVGIDIAPPGFCISETIAKFPDVAGLDFEVSDIDCDVIAKQGSLRISVSLVGRSSKTAVFEYFPANFDPPAIIAIDERTVTISLKSIGSILRQTHRFEGRTIVYDIRSIEYPRRDPMRLDER